MQGQRVESGEQAGGGHQLNPTRPRRTFLHLVTLGSSCRRSSATIVLANNYGGQRPMATMLFVPINYRCTCCDSGNGTWYAYSHGLRTPDVDATNGSSRACLMTCAKLG
eukprot:354395-Chlamydomonas_euryale.AAC.3